MLFSVLFIRSFCDDWGHASCLRNYLDTLKSLLLMSKSRSGISAVSSNRGNLFISSQVNLMAARISGQVRRSLTSNAVTLCRIALTNVGTDRETEK